MAMMLGGFEELAERSLSVGDHGLPEEKGTMVCWDLSEPFRRSVVVVVVVFPLFFTFCNSKKNYQTPARNNMN